MSKLYPWLVEALKWETGFVAFDLETTGLDPFRNRIVEIGAIRFRRRLGPPSSGQLELFDESSARFEEEAVFDELVNPRMSMPADVVKINGITDEMLKGKPFAEEVLPRFLEFAKGSVLIAHNAPFDIGFLDMEMQRLGLTGRSTKVIDTRLFAKEAWPKRQAYNLQRLAFDLKIPVGTAHRGCDDARTCKGLFMECLAVLGID